MNDKKKRRWGLSSKAKERIGLFVLSLAIPAVLTTAVIGSGFGWGVGLLVGGCMWAFILIVGWAASWVFSA